MAVWEKLFSAWFETPDLLIELAERLNQILISR